MGDNPIDEERHEMLFGKYLRIQVSSSIQRQYFEERNK